jgi:predicted nucleotidyltransferase
LDTIGAMNVVPDVAALRAALLPLWQTGRFRLIALFGSAARGTASPSSDLDLAFLPKEEGMDAMRVTAEVVRRTHHNEVDVIDLSRADPLLAMEVARSGVLLHGDDPSDFAEFRSLAFRRYVDTEKLRRAQRRALDLFQREHGAG